MVSNGQTVLLTDVLDDQEAEAKAQERVASVG